MSDGAVHLTTAGWAFMLGAWIVVTSGAALCMYKVLSVGKRRE